MKKLFLFSLVFALFSFNSLAFAENPQNYTYHRSYLAAPRITAPNQVGPLTNYPRYARLAWTSVSGARSYQIELACDYCNSASQKFFRPTTYTSVTPYFTTPALPGDNIYRFRVRAVNAYQTPGYWSDYVFFRFDTKKLVIRPVVPPVPKPVSLPDLVVTNIVMRRDIVDNATHRPLWFVEIKNIGKACASNFRVKLEGYTYNTYKYQAVLPSSAVSSQAGYSSPVWVGQLCPGDLAGRGVNFVFPMNMGPNPLTSVRAMIDPTYVVRESNESNNERYMNTSEM